MNIHSPQKLKQALVKEGVITIEQLKEAEQTAEREDQILTKILAKLEFATDEQLAAFIGDKMQIPYVNLNNYTIDRKVLELIPEKIARRHKFIPLFKIENELTVAMSNPLGPISIEDISKLVECPVEAVIASEECVTTAIDQWYGVGNSRKELIENLAEELKVIKEERGEGTLHVQQVSESHPTMGTSEAAIIRLVNSYLARAVVEGASHIHFQPKKDFMNIRFRIGGSLYDKGRQSNKESSSITSRIKIMSKMDISKKTIPQEGSMSLSLRDKNIDVRSSTFPSLYGENIVLRIFDKTRGVLKLSELSLCDEDLNTFKKVIKTTKGIILATGPAGSGKATTIYSFIDTLNKEAKNIMTIEDPIRHKAEGIVQTNVDSKTGVNFARALRSILPQDPDIIYVGEIRDAETAEAAVHAALAGHLVFSTLHTYDAVGAITRLRDIGIENGLIGSALKCSFAQRLVRKICTKCKNEYQPDESFLKKLGLSSDTKLYQGEGCEFCDGTGYKGRIGIFEVLVLDQDMNRLIAKGASEPEIMDTARASGFKTLFEDGLEKVKKGITTLEELKRVTME